MSKPYLSRKRSSRWHRLRALATPQNAIAAGILIVSVLIVAQLQQTQLLTEVGLQEAIHNLGAIAPLLYIVLITLTVVVSHLPGLPLVCAAGAVWGGILGGVYSLIGGFLGSLLTYGLGRTLGNSAIKALTGKTLTFSTHRGETFLGWLIFITRLLPIFPFDLISYGAGVTRLSLPIYASATLVGMAPPTFAIAYMGEGAMINMPLTILFWSLFGVILVGVPWGIRRYNWLGLRDIIFIR